MFINNKWIFINNKEYNFLPVEFESYPAQKELKAVHI